MSSVYHGDGTIPSLVTPPAGLRVEILSSTDATPIVIQTTAPHGFTSGAATDTVEVEGHLVNTNANGVWQISVVDATHFSLDGSAGTGGGPGGATGYAVDWSVNPSPTIPSDGDLSQAAAWNPSVENLTNMVPFLNRRCGRFRLQDIYFAENTAGYATYSSLVAVATTTFTDFSAPGLNLFATGASQWADGPGYFPILSDFSTGDALFVQYTGTFTSVQLSGAQPVKIALAYAANGGAFAPDVSSQLVLTPPALVPVNLSAVFFASGPHERFDIGLMGAMTSVAGPSTASIFALTPYRLTAFHYRPN